MKNRAQKRIVISVCGEGFGHTTRSLSLATKFKKENPKNEILFLAYGKSREFIEKKGYKVFKTCPELSLDGKNGEFNILRSFKRFFSTKTNLFRAIYLEYKIIKKYKPDFIITDCKYSTAIASLFLKRKYNLITNQNKVVFQKKSLVELILFLGHKILNFLNKKADRLIVPDLAPPHTICEYNIKKTKNIVFAGSLIDYEIKKDYKPIKGDYILALIGGYPYRSVILEELIKIANRQKKKVKIVCGNHKKMFNKLQKKATFKGIEIIEFVEDMQNLIVGSSFIICPGGHSTLMEAVSFGKPVITIPDLNHPEQQANAKKVVELGFGISLSYKNLEKLEERIKEIESDKKYQKKAEELWQIAKQSHPLSFF